MPVRLGQEVQALPWGAGLTELGGLHAGVRRDEALAAVRRLLDQNGVDSAALDARLLVCAAAHLTAVDLIRAPEAALDAASVDRLRAFASRRAAREPLSRILGKREFWSLSLAVSPAVLDPRDDTETLVGAALEAFASRRNEPLRILDLGIGSGAILCALLKELPGAIGIGVDISAEAAEIARANLAACGFVARATVIVGSWGDRVSGDFDLIVSNPPYIVSAEIQTLDPEVRNHDPFLALDGGPDGLDAYRAIAPDLARLLRAASGRFFVEIGAGQAEQVTAILAAAGLKELRTLPDLSGRARVVAGAS